jgi:hypothetical protein
VYLRGRRIAMLGADSAFGRALRERLQAESTDSIRELEGPDSTVLEEIDVLVLCDPDLDRLEAVERFIRGTRQRQLPPEVWAVQREAADGLARHYYRDLRVTYRALHVAPDALDDPTRARRAARTALFCIRRGFNYVPTAQLWRAPGDFLRFRRTVPQRPPQADGRQRRLELARAA